MSKDEGNCPFCGAVNSYNRTHCSACVEELPWANIVRARGHPSAAIGAEPGSLAGSQAKDVVDGLPILPRGGFTKILMVVAGLVFVYIMLHVLTPALHQAASGGGPLAANGVSNAAGGGVTERFKKANPVFDQDRQDRQEERKAGNP